MSPRDRPSAGLSEEMVLARLTRGDHELAARALRRHDAWQQAIERGATSETKRTLRRAWERARDEALAALSMTEPDQERACGAADPQPVDRPPDVRHSAT